MKRFITIILITFIGFRVLADIAPNPVIANGIHVNAGTDIKMTYEKIIVDLTLDSSYVHCYFRLYNAGKATKIQVGYPNMNYTYNNFKPKDFKFNRIYAYENGIEIGKTYFFLPDSSKPANSISNDRSWYLWDTHFNKNETKIIEIIYSLPRGITKRNLYYYFEYLLSTGAGWKDKIDTAEVIINLKNIDKDLLLKIEPANYIQSGNTIKWKYINLEPTRKNDISIFYEINKGDYLVRYKKYSAIVILDNKTILDDNLLSKKNNHGDFETADFADIFVTGDLNKVKNCIPNFDTTNLNCSNGFILIYSKKFVIEKINKIIKNKFPKTKCLKYNSISEFEDKYVIIINGTQHTDSNRYQDIGETEEDKFVNIMIKTEKTGKKIIDIQLKE